MRFKQDLKATVLAKVLLHRYEALQMTHSDLVLKVSKREAERASHFKDQENSFKKVIREQDMRLSHLDQEIVQLDEETQLLKEELRISRDQKEELEQNLILFSSEANSKQLALEKKAEMTVDERYKSRHETIKCYFDSNITKILLNQ